MPLVVKDRVKETTTTTGTGAVTLAGPAAGFQSFSVIGNGNTTYYAIVGGTEWEVGIGTYSTTGPTLTRDTVLESSNSGSLVNFSAGTKDVFVTYPAEKSVNEDASGNVGIGTTAPVARLNVVNSTLNAQLRLQDVTTDATNKYGVVGTGHYTNAQSPILAVGVGSLSASSTVYIGGGFGALSAATAIQFYTAANNTTLAGTEAMRIDNGGRVLIGTSSAATGKFRVSQVDGAVGVLFNGDTRGVRFGFNATGSLVEGVDNTGTASYQPLIVGGSDVRFTTSSTERMRLDASGNLGINATPQAWGANFKGIEGYGASTFFLSGNSVNGITTVGNSYQNGTNWVYTTTGAAARYQVGITTAPHIWSYAASGTAGATVTWSEAMRIDSSGNVGIGTASPSFKLDVQSASAVTSRVYCTDATGTSYAAVTAGTASGVNSVMYSYSGAGWYGTTTNHPMLFMTNNTERARIDSNGNVGIGTSSPGFRLDVVNNVAGLARFSMTNPNAGMTQTDLRIGAGSGSNDVFFGINSTGTFIDDRSGGQNIVFSRSGSERFRIGPAGQIGLSGANYGTSGQVLTSNGSGSAPTWQAVSSKYELISTSTASAASTVDFTGLSNTYSEYIIVCRQFFTSANALVGIRTSTNNGTSYDSAANTYGWSQMNVNTGGTAGGWTGQGTEIACGYTGSGSEIDYMRIHLVNAGVATRPMFDVVVGLQQTSYGQTARTIGWRQATTAINAIRIFMSSGTITGTFYLYGVRT